MRDRNTACRRAAAALDGARPPEAAAGAEAGRPARIDAGRPRPAGTLRCDSARRSRASAGSAVRWRGRFDRGDALRRYARKDPSARHVDFRHAFDLAVVVDVEYPSEAEAAVERILGLRNEARRVEVDVAAGIRVPRTAGDI